MPIPPQGLCCSGGGGEDDAALLNGQNGAYYLNRANHTGTQLASTISDFDAAADARVAAGIVGVQADADQALLDAAAAQADIDAHVADTAGAHAATAISNAPAGGIAATTVQAALNELDVETVKIAGAQIITGRKNFSAAVGYGSHQSFTASGSISSSASRLVVFNGPASQTLELPSIDGLEFEVFNTGSNAVSVTSTGNTFLVNASLLATFSLAAGTGARFVLLGSIGAWYVSLDVQHAQNVVQSFVATGSIQVGGGQIVTFSGASSQQLTLPAAVIGMSYDIWNIDTSDAVTIARAGADTFRGGGTSFSLASLQKVSLSCLTTGVWYYGTPEAIV